MKRICFQMITIARITHVGAHHWPRFFTLHNLTDQSRVSGLIIPEFKPTVKIIGSQKNTYQDDYSQNPNMGWNFF